MTCQQPSFRDPLRWCGAPSYGQVSPGSTWTPACFYHYGQAIRRKWLVKR